MILRRFVRQTLEDEWWESTTTDLVSKLVETHPEHGLYLKKNGFLKKEVLKSDELLMAFTSENTCVGFVYLMTGKYVRCLYITLLCSLKGGVGRHLVDFLKYNHLYPHQFLMLRATYKSVRYFAKQKFIIHDSNTLCTMYVSNLTDELLTEQTLQASTEEELFTIVQLLQDRDWLAEDSEEFPMMYVRESLARAYYANTRLRVATRLSKKYTT